MSSHLRREESTKSYRWINCSRDRRTYYTSLGECGSTSLPGFTVHGMVVVLVNQCCRSKHNLRKLSGQARRALLSHFQPRATQADRGDVCWCGLRQLYCLFHFIPRSAFITLPKPTEKTTHDEAPAESADIAHASPRTFVQPWRISKISLNNS